MPMRMSVLFLLAPGCYDVHHRVPRIVNADEQQSERDGSREEQGDRAIDNGPSDGHGALMIADTTSAPVRCTMVGVLNAPSPPVCVRSRLSATNVMTTN